MNAILKSEFKWRPLTALSVGTLTPEEIYAALTKGATAKQYPHYTTSFEARDNPTYFNFSRSRSDISHEEVMMCWERTEDKKNPKFRWRIGGDFRTGSGIFSRKVMLEGRWIKNNDAMRSRFAASADVESDVSLSYVAVQLSIDEQTAASDLRQFLSDDFIQWKPPEGPIDWDEVWF